MKAEIEKSTLVADIVHGVSVRRRFVLATFISVTVAAAVVAFLLPRWYASSTTILPPRSTGLLGGLGDVSSLMRQISPLRSLTGAAGGGELYNYVAILQSRPSLQRIVRDFDLFEEYDISNHSMEDAVDALRSNIEFLVNEEGTLTVMVYDRDPRRAAAMADSLVSILDELNIALGTRQAHANRLFIERRLEQNRADLKVLEDTLKAFQEKHGMVAIPEETATSISGVAQFYWLKATKELQVGIMEQTMSSDNVLLQSAKQELAEIDKRLKNVPELGVAYLRLYRDYAVQQKIFEMLTPLYEQAKIEEQRNTPTLLVLERANIPERAAKPQRKVIVLIFALLALIIGIGASVVRERLERMRAESPAEYDRLIEPWKRLARRRRTQ